LAFTLVFKLQLGNARRFAEALLRCSPKSEAIRALDVVEAKLPNRGSVPKPELGNEAKYMMRNSFSPREKVRMRAIPGKVRGKAPH
jgi:hypothetical protein